MYDALPGRCGVSQHLANRTAYDSFSTDCQPPEEVAARMVECRRVAEPLNYRLDEINGADLLVVAANTNQVQRPGERA